MFRADTCKIGNKKGWINLIRAAEDEPPPRHPSVRPSALDKRRISAGKRAEPLQSYLKSLHHLHALRSSNPIITTKPRMIKNS
jgi:hypothetical protein